MSGERSRCGFEMAARKGTTSKSGAPKASHKDKAPEESGGFSDNSREDNFLGVFGHANIDYIMPIDRFPRPNTSCVLVNAKRLFGGVGGNIARVSAELGVPTALATFVGSDFPSDYRDIFSKAGVDLTDLKTMDAYLTPTCYIMNDPEGQQFTIINPGPMKDMQCFDEPYHTIKTSSILHISTGSFDYYFKAANLARQAGKKISFDPSFEVHYQYDKEKLEKMLPLCDYFFLNEHELKVVMGNFGFAAPERILEMVPTLIVSRGKDGSSIFTKDGRVDIGIFRVEKVVDPTGAGDAFRAGFYAGMHKGLDLRTCARMGAAVSSFIVEGWGPQANIPTWDKVDERLRSIP